MTAFVHPVSNLHVQGERFMPQRPRSSVLNFGKMQKNTHKQNVCEHFQI